MQKVVTLSILLITNAMFYL